MAKAKKQIIIEVLQAKGLEIYSIEWEPIRNGGIMCGCEGGWTIFIDEDKTPLRGGESPILGYNVNEVLEAIKQVSRGYDFCPICNCGIDHQEERLMFCNNCRSDFSDSVQKEVL